MRKKKKMKIHGCQIPGKPKDNIKQEKKTTKKRKKMKMRKRIEEEGENGEENPRLLDARKKRKQKK